MAYHLEVVEITAPCQEEHVLTDGTQRRVLGVIKNAPIRAHIALRGADDDFSLHSARFRCSLLYDCDPERPVDFVQSRPISYVAQANEAGDSATLEVRILVLSSQHEDLFFRVKFTAIPRDLPNEPVSVVSQPIRVVSKSAQLRPLGTDTSIGIKGRGRKRKRTETSETGTSTTSLAEKTVPKEASPKKKAGEKKKDDVKSRKRGRKAQPKKMNKLAVVPQEVAPKPEPPSIEVSIEPRGLASQLRGLLAAFVHIPLCKRQEHMDQVLRLCSNESLAPLGNFLETLNTLVFTQRPLSDSAPQQAMPAGYADPTGAASDLSSSNNSLSDSALFPPIALPSPSDSDAVQQGQIYSPCGPTQLNPDNFVSARYDAFYEGETNSGSWEVSLSKSLSATNFQSMTNSGSSSPMPTYPPPSQGDTQPLKQQQQPQQQKQPQPPPPQQQHQQLPPQQHQYQYPQNYNNQHLQQFQQQHQPLQQQQYPFVKQYQPQPQQMPPQQPQQQVPAHQQMAYYQQQYQQQMQQSALLNSFAPSVFTESSPRGAQAQQQQQTQQGFYPYNSNSSQASSTGGDQAMSMSYSQLSLLDYLLSDTLPTYKSSVSQMAPLSNIHRWSGGK